MARTRVDVPALARALADETKLLTMLRQVLDRQREAVARNDLSAVDGSVFDAQRVLLSLSQARRRRRSLIVLASGEENLHLGDLPKVLGPAMTSELQSALDELLQVAGVVAREMELNRQILNGALMAGNEILQALGRPSKKAVYGTGPEAPEAPRATNLLLNRQV
jgi:flagellar biosynthesis/type III secretory pathway chaperone